MIQLYQPHTYGELIIDGIVKEYGQVIPQEIHYHLIYIFETFSKNILMPVAELKENESVSLNWENEHACIYMEINKNSCAGYMTARQSKLCDSPSKDVADLYFTLPAEYRVITTCIKTALFFFQREK